MNRLFKFLTWTFTFSIILGASAMAQEVDDLEDISLGELMNMQIESASKQAEPLSEAPVPVSVITSDMITHSGARTLHEALTLFVPGYTDSEDRNEMNYAARGIYATSQQKVLVMINGHRINSRSYLTAMPDYGIALHNLERIEVLRGPGSSLYGNVALSGVVNLITKDGAQYDKTMFEVGMGNHGQKRIRFLTGDGSDDWSVLGWGQYYTADGEEYDLDGNEPFNEGKTGTILIDGVKNESSHDVGVTYEKGHFSYFLASRRGQWVEPYGGGNNPYEYENYRTFNEAGPGLGISQRHLGFTYSNELGGGWDFSINPYFDSSEIESVFTTPPGGGVAFSWNDENLGLIAQTNKDYSVGSQSGNLLLGVQVDAFEVTESSLVSYADGELDEYVDDKETALLKAGGETIYSGFVQAKHRFSREWIINGGARYDSKEREDGEDVERLSPRLAFIYLPSTSWEFKLSYSESFVDAPYWYRFNQRLGAFGGSVALEPEVLKAAQFQTVYKSDRGIRNAVTLFHQSGEDLIVNRGTAAAGTPEDPKYVNSGAIESIGLENELALLKKSYQLFWNLSLSKAQSAENYTMLEDKFAHAPALTSNVIFTYLFGENWSANVSVRYFGETVFNAGTDADPEAESVDAATTLNLGGRFEAGNGLYVDARGYNVLDTEHYVGGQTGFQIPFRQPGRWYLLNLGYAF